MFTVGYINIYARFYQRSDYFQVLGLCSPRKKTIWLGPTDPRYIKSRTHFHIFYTPNVHFYAPVITKGENIYAVNGSFLGPFSQKSRLVFNKRSICRLITRKC